MNEKHISPQAFKEVLTTESDNPTVDFINVCTPAEYAEKSIPGVRNVPLDELDSRVDEFSGKRTVYIHCRSGKRGRQAVEKLRAFGVSAELVNVEGGLMGWEEAGFETQSDTNRLPIMRQVLIAAGSLVLLGYLLSIVVAPAFIYLSVFVWAGLTVAGVTGWCGMSYLLARMPWNR